ncbi:MAG TPA: N-formylglutamate amidohydrolase [Kiloniellales bacterium]|jgi:N-formylglutamate amidohydrolase|nr:N-formylglutamate amidohydrolase [Kiloniellales bacterium]
MDVSIASAQASTPSHEVLQPLRQSLPLVISSPHSGSDYPPHFLAASRLDPLMLRRSEDSFVDEIFACAPDLGAPLLRALFPRAYVDPNREPYELDPTMFDGPLPHFANTKSPRVAAGLGTIARVVANGAEIYRQKLPLSEALERIRIHYYPYHRSLSDLVAETRRRFGYCILLDCHSMPSSASGHDAGSAKHRVDFVLGDCHGTACAQIVLERASDTLSQAGFRVSRNRPYSGGFVTRHYGRPDKGVHALQIEINRALYMDEARIRRRPGLRKLAAFAPRLLEALSGVPEEELLPR